MKNRNKTIKSLIKSNYIAEKEYNNKNK